MRCSGHISTPSSAPAHGELRTFLFIGSAWRAESHAAKATRAKTASTSGEADSSLSMGLLSSSIQSSFKSRIVWLVSRARTRSRRLSPLPCHLASAHNCRPRSDVGPQLLPPWKRHFVLPRMAGPPHCSRVRLLLASQRRQKIRPPAVWRVESGVHSTRCPHAGRPLTHSQKIVEQGVFTLQLRHGPTKPFYLRRCVRQRLYTPADFGAG